MTLQTPSQAVPVVVIGGGPAGLMAAQTLQAAGQAVHLFDAMPTVGRKFLLAGIGGLNLTHAEALPNFVSRYADRAPTVAQWLQVLGPQGVRDWAAALGIQTFVGSSQRVFPTDMKAAPLLRAWLRLLRHPPAGSQPVQFHTRCRWEGQCQPLPDGGWGLSFLTPQGRQTVSAQVVVLALGGGSWARLGSDGAWVEALQTLGAEVAPLQPANAGFEVAVRGRHGWSDFLRQEHAGQPLKNVALSFTASNGQDFARRGEFVLTEQGIEGSLVYAASALLRDEIAAQGQATLTLDLKPDWPLERLISALSRPRGRKSFAASLKASVDLSATAVALLHECLETDTLHDPQRLAQRIKALALGLVAVRPIDEAISTAGGVALSSLDSGLMLQTAPGVFCAGEMLDWEAPTGGYLLTACLASGRVAGGAAAAYLAA